MGTPLDLVERAATRGTHQWWVASEGASPVRSAGIGSIKLTEIETTRFTPMGRRHAVQDDSGETACGRSLSRLHLFPTMPWGESPLASRNCPACLVKLEHSAHA
jgi:hypothetical protein